MAKRIRLSWELGRNFGANSLVVRLIMDAEAGMLQKLLEEWVSMNSEAMHYDFLSSLLHRSQFR